MSVKKHAFKIPTSRLKGIRGILLDLDNTLYRYEPCQQAALKSAYMLIRRKAPMDFSELKLRYEEARNNIKKPLIGKAASHSRLLYFQNLFEACLRGTDAKFALEVESAYWAGYFTRMKLRPGVLDFLTWCRKNGIVTCILTDLTADIQFKKMIHLKIDKLIDWVVSSEEAGADKPHKSMFRLALKKMGLSRSDVLMIGDNYHKDILGAKALGIRTV